MPDQRSVGKAWVDLGQRGLLDTFTVAIALRSLDRSVSVFDVNSGMRLGTPIEIPEGDGEVIAFSLDGTTLVLGGGAGRERGPLSPGRNYDPAIHRSTVWSFTDFREVP